MAELKHVYSESYLGAIADTVHRYYPAFPRADFLQNTSKQPHWPALALKQRMRLIASQLYELLGLPFENSVAILMPSSNHFGGGYHGDYASMFFPDIIEQYGLDDFDTSMQALEHFTTRSSSEFAIRPFLQRYPDKTLQQMLAWTEHDNDKIRRLASEGCRPRLPWAMALPEFKQNPAPVLAILEKLKHDHSVFVRRSVANNLNDIAKDNPDHVIATCQRWHGTSPETDWVVKHACRTLLKQSHPQALSLFGFTQPSHIRLNRVHVSPTVTIGDSLHFSFELASDQALGKLRLEFAINFVKAKGKRHEKVFHISESIVEEQKKQISKDFSFKPVSTRRYYPGQHGFSLRANGKPLHQATFELLPN